MGERTFKGITITEGAVVDGKTGISISRRGADRGKSARRAARQYKRDEKGRFSSTGRVRRRKMTKEQRQKRAGQRRALRFQAAATGARIFSRGLFAMTEAFHQVTSDSMRIKDPRDPKGRRTLSVEEAIKTARSGGFTDTQKKRASRRASRARLKAAGAIGGGAILLAGGLTAVGRGLGFKRGPVGRAFKSGGITVRKAANFLIGDVRGGKKARNSLRSAFNRAAQAIRTQASVVGGSKLGKRFKIRNLPDIRRAFRDVGGTSGIARKTAARFGKGLRRFTRGRLVISGVVGFDDNISISRIGQKGARAARKLRQWSEGFMD